MHAYMSVCVHMCGVIVTKPSNSQPLGLKYCSCCLISVCSYLITDKCNYLFSIFRCLGLLMADCLQLLPAP